MKVTIWVLSLLMLVGLYHYKVMYDDLTDARRDVRWWHDWADSYQGWYLDTVEAHRETKRELVECLYVNQEGT